MGAAWWLGHGLSARGHQVQVVAAQQLEGEPSHVRVRTLDAFWPPEAVQRLAVSRAAQASRALPAIQREILGCLGATSDPSQVELGGVDAFIGFGIQSPHVRGLAERALGRVATVLHLGEDDVALAPMPVLQLATRPHTVVAHYEAAASGLSEQLRRSVEMIPPGADPPAPGPPEVGERPSASGMVGGRCAVVFSSGRDHRFGADAVAAIRRVGLEVRHVSFADASVRRFDDLVRRDTAVVVLADGDAGDLPGLAMRFGRPLIVSAASSGAAEVVSSGAGWIVDGRRSLEEAMSTVVRGGAESQVASGISFASGERSWDAMAPRYERLFELEGVVSSGLPVP